jgi:uncharacterized membrane protein
MEFTAGSAIRFGWETFKKRPWFFVGASVVIAIAYIIVGLISSGIDAGLGGSAEDPTGVGGIINFVLGTFIGMGVTAFYLAAHDNPQTVELSALWHPQPFWKFLGASILVTLAVVVGLALLVVPGIIAMLFFLFTTFIVIDRDLGPIEAMKESMRITSGHRWTLLGLIVLLILIACLGVIALVVGLLVAMPVITLAFAHAYRVLSHKAGTTPPAADAALAG